MNLSITSCENCPFYDDNYCNLAIKLNEKRKTNHQTYVADEWREGKSPKSCPLKTSMLQLNIKNMKNSKAFLYALLHGIMIGVVISFLFVILVKRYAP